MSEIYQLFIPLAQAHGPTPHGAGAHSSAQFKDLPLISLGSWDVALLLALIVASLLYVLGHRSMQNRSGQDRVISTWRNVSFSFAIATMVLATLIHAPSETLAWVHMIQHMLIMMVAAPLLAFSRPSFVMIWALPDFIRKRIHQLSRRVFRPVSTLASFMFQPLLLWLFYALILWVWHWPKLYEAALQIRWIHEIQHFGFFLSSFLFAKVLLDPLFRRSMSRGVAIIYLFTTSVHASLLGFFMTIAPNPWYEQYAITAPLMGYTALEDQQLAGAIMWMPACLTYLVLAVFAFTGWIKESSLKIDRIEANQIK